MREIQRTAIARKLMTLRERNLLSQADQRRILNLMEDHNIDQAATENLINGLDDLTGEKTNWIDIASIPFLQIQQTIFLKTLLGNTTLFTELRALPPQKDSRVFLNYEDEAVDEIDKFIHQWNSSLNIYFIPNLSDGKGGRKENIRQVTSFFCDFDVVKDYDSDYRRVMGIILGFEYQPSAIIHSGRGLHTYWILKNPVDVDQGVIDTWESIQKGLAAHLGADPSVTDINNPMRLPGSLNIKDPKNPVPCSVIAMSCSLYSFNDFLKYRFAEKAQQDFGTADIDSEVIKEVALTMVRCGMFSTWESNQEMRCFCPFHPDGRNPNLRFNIAKGLFRCFSCGESGTAHRLKEQIEHYGMEQLMHHGRKAS